MTLSSLQAMIMVDLFRNRDGLLDFTLYSRYKKPVRELLDSLRGLQEAGLIKELGERLSLTEKGFDFMVESKRLAIDRKENEETAANFRRPQLGINEFYVPRVTLDKVQE